VRRALLPAVAAATLVATAGCGGGSGGTPSKATPALIRETEPSVVEVIVPDGLGSGVIWDQKGNIVTNAHVVAGAKKVQVVLANGLRIPGKVLARDKLSDLAVVHVKKTGLPPATFAVKMPAVGEPALALGAPFGYERSVSAGIISGVHRSLPPERGRLDQYIDLIQTDAAISPGNSGGALVNSDGTVVGINVAYIPPKYGAVEIGFAIPATTVRDVVGDLLAGRRVNHPYMGLRAVDLWPELVGMFHTKAKVGALIVDVAHGSPAQKASLAPGDVIASVDGVKTPDADSLLAAIRHKAPGQKVKLVVTTYAGTSQSVELTLADQTKQKRK
jgi:serine protease DegQ